MAFPSEEVDEVSNYFPFGFQYPQGFAYSDKNPDPGIETLRHRTELLNAYHDASGLPGEIFAAAMKLFQTESSMDVAEFWSAVQVNLTANEVAEVAKSLAPLVKDEPPRLDFPNAIALCDCRFVSTLEWQHLRRYSIGGSDAAVVVGKTNEYGDQIDGFTQLSKFQSRRGLFYEKQATFQEVPNSPQKQQIFDYGHAVEDYVIDRAATLLGAFRYPEYRMFAHKKYPFITCNPDGILWFPDGSLALFEAKTAVRFKMDDWKQDIPAYYQPQPRQYMEVLNDPKIQRGFIACCFGGLPTDWIMHGYTRDIVIGEKQMEQEAAFWNDYIVPGVLPPLSGNPDLDLQAVYCYSAPVTPATNTSATLSADCEALFEEYLELSSDHKALKKSLGQAKTEETLLKDAISNQIPEGVTIVAMPDDVTYKISMRKSATEKVYSQALIANSTVALETCQALSNAMQEATLPYTNPDVQVVRPTPVRVPKTKKGAATA